MTAAILAIRPAIRPAATSRRNRAVDFVRLLIPGRLAAAREPNIGAVSQP